MYQNYIQLWANFNTQETRIESQIKRACGWPYKPGPSTKRKPFIEGRSARRAHALKKIIQRLAHQYLSSKRIKTAPSFGLHLHYYYKC
jgi:hypothetical protein